MTSDLGRADRMIRILIVTSLFSFCPLYRLIGVSTCKT